MAKVPISRLNTAPKDYTQDDFNQLIEDLQAREYFYFKIKAFNLALIQKLS